MTFAENFSVQNRTQPIQFENMNRKIIKTIDELEKVLEYFNDFHDGFLKSIKIMSGNKFTGHLPRQKPEQRESNEERLRNTSLLLSEKKGMFIEIHHYNYDWPKKTPDNRITLYLKNVKDVDSNITQMVGVPIFECEAVKEEKSGLGLIFIFDTYADNKPEQIRLRPLEFDEISIQEKG
jgi:hypothetical protein